MENSMSCKPISSSSSSSSSSSIEKTTDHDSFEESGWTMYFEDFFAQNNEEDHDIHDHNGHSSFSLDHDESSSIVSDAASLVVKKSANDHHGHDQVVGLPIDNRSFKYSLCFKKRRTKGALVDDALEDTASSPVNSPKVYEDTMINQHKRNAKHKDNMEISQDKGSGSSQIDKRSDLGFILGESDNTELKKRGLCLFPLSLVVNYLG